MSYPIQTPTQLASHLRAFRTERGLSQAALGRMLGLSQARIARIEADPLSISVRQFLLLVSALGLRISLEPVAGSGPDTLAAATPSPPQGEW